MLLVGKGPAAFVLSMAFVGASVAPATAPQTLAPSQCTITSMSGFDNLCLFNSFAYGTRSSATALRREVCAFMRNNRKMVMPGVVSFLPGVDHVTIEQYVVNEGSAMTSLTVETLRDEGAGVHVAGSLSMMLRRNLWLYWLKNGVYDLILATTVVPGALPLVLQFTPNRSSIGHYDIINIDERVGVDRPMFSQSSESIWGATVRKQDLPKPPLLKPATKAARTTQGLRVPDRKPTRPVVKRDRYFEDEEVTAESSLLKSTTQISNSTQGHRLRAHEKVWYRGTMLATVLTVHVDEDPPYYTILQDDGVERQTELCHLQPANDPRFLQPTTTPMARTGTERASATGAPRKGVVKRDRYFEDEEVIAGSTAIEVFTTTWHDGWM
jgi:hypothetical protein